MHKYIFKLLSVQLFILFFAVISLVSPSLSFASELIGTHLGESDVGFQIGIIQTVLIPNGLEAGSPVTVMVPVTMLLDSNQNGTVQELANAVRGGGFFPIVRINGVCTSEAANGSLNAVNTARSIFGSDALIVWGNEVNNQDTECESWPNYFTGMLAVSSQASVSPAALDYYMGLEAYQVDTMFAAQSGMADLFNTAPRAANAYGCINESSDTCDPLSTTTQTTGYAAINGPVYLTEFSLSPGGNSFDAPDTDIKKVLEFIENRAAETGAVKVTPLVRNVCNSEGAWLLYINGQLFTNLGTPVDDTCEGTSGGTGYGSIIYPYYEADETKSFITPIRNVVDGDSTKYSISFLRKELTTQGYQPYCASEDVKIKPSYDTEGLINRYFELTEAGKIPTLPHDETFLEIEATETLSTVSSKYPLWRDVSNQQFLMSSLEEYFGFKDVYIQNPSTTVMTSSPINSLLSEPQLCLQGWRNLVAQELACERLETPGECELFTRKIPTTDSTTEDYTVGTLLKKLKEYEPNYREGKAKDGCQQLVAGDRFNNQELFKGLLNTPTYFDRAYRYGFIVAAIHSKNDALAETNLAMKIFNFFSEPTKLLEPRDEVLVVAFKLPDIGTNKFQDEANAVQFWDDPLSLTRMLLSTNERNKLHEANGDDEDPEEKILSRSELQDDLFEAAESQKGKQGPDDKIFCSTKEEETDEDGNTILSDEGVTTTSCQNYLTKALTDIINGVDAGCGDTEAVNVIKDIAGLDNPEEPYGRVFNSDNGVEVILNLFRGDKTHPESGSGDQRDPQRADTKDPAEKLNSIFNITKENWDSKDDTPTTVDFYIVYPMGFELDAVENAMKGAFFTRAQLAVLEEQQSVDGFAMTGPSMGLTASSKGFRFEDPDRTAAGECGETEVLDPDTGLPTGEILQGVCMEDVSVTVKQDSAGVGILGARLGFWMKQVQKQLSSRSGEAWKYFNSCATTEEFMLGRCRGGSNGLGSGGDSGSGFGYNTCGYELGTGFCSPEYLRPFFQEAGISNPDLEADKASRICQRESSSKPDAYNFNCLKDPDDGGSVDYSIGLFQINMLPRCPGSFKDANGVEDTAVGFQPYDIPCEIVDQERLNQCFEDKLAINSGSAAIINEHMPLGPQISPDTSQDAIKQKADENIRAMVQIRKAWNNWDAWKAPGCDNY